MRARWLSGVVIVGLSACGGPPRAAVATDSSDGDPGEDPEDPGDQLPTVVAPAVAPSVAPAAHGGGAALLAEAQRELAAVRETHYAHHTSVDEPRGAYDFDCSGFVGYALARVAPDALRAVQDATVPRPLAKHYESALAAGIGPWRPVARADQLQPGDVIAWLEPPVKRSRNTGHVMIVAGAPTQGRQPAGQLVVRVIDSSHSGHGRGDRRIQDRASGLGTGDLVLVVDDAGRAIGYRWSTSRRSVEYRTQVALARLN